MMTVIGWTTMGRVRAFLVFVVSMLAFACSHVQSIRVDGFGSRLASGCAEWTGCTGLVTEAESRVAKCHAEEDGQTQCTTALNDLRLASSAILSKRWVLRTRRCAVNRATSLVSLGCRPNPNSLRDLRGPFTPNAPLD